MPTDHAPYCGELRPVSIRLGVENTCASRGGGNTQVSKSKWLMTDPSGPIGLVSVVRPWGLQTLRVRGHGLNWPTDQRSSPVSSRAAFWPIYLLKGGRW